MDVIPLSVCTRTRVGGLRISALVLTNRRETEKRVQVEHGDGECVVWFEYVFCAWYASGECVV